MVIKARDRRGGFFRRRLRNGAAGGRSADEDSHSRSRTQRAQRLSEIRLFGTTERRRRGRVQPERRGGGGQKRRGLVPARPRAGGGGGDRAPRPKAGAK